MKYIFGNWKMYLNHKESIELAKHLAKKVQKSEGLEVAVFPAVISLVEVKKQLEKSVIAIGAQNCAWTPKGAYTGAVSAYIFADAGCQYALVGHSERRHIFGESDEDVRKKLEAVLDAGLVPVLCIGETKDDRDQDKVQYRLKKQLMKALDGLVLNDKKIIIAYEPVWAIGTGNPCNPSDADDIHGWIKLEVKNYLGYDVEVIYGGSVNEENVVSYVSLETVDGVLVGGASVKLDSFSSIIEAVKN